MPAAPKQTVFISHSSTDKTVAEELHRTLTARFHLECWLDDFNLRVGKEPFSAQIVSALQSSNLFVLVDSPAARGSDYVSREVQTAHDLQMPVYRVALDERQEARLRRIRIGWLAWRIQLRLARGAIIAALTLVLLLAALIVVTFFLGTQVAPALAKAARNLPEAARFAPTLTPLPAPSDPKVAAPFHFKPDTVLLQDDFNDPAYQGKVDDGVLSLSNAIRPDDPQVQIGQQDGSLLVHFPVSGLDPKVINTWRVEIDSKALDGSQVQYFGLRARSLSGTYLRDISVSLAIYGNTYSRAGFGWYFTDRSMAFFHSLLALPDADFTSYITTGTAWHAYEILREPQKSAFYYYVDGQMVGMATPQHARDWDKAQLELLIFSTANKLNDPTGWQKVDTRMEIDQVVVGGFKAR
jgi:hypothetical protein